LKKKKYKHRVSASVDGVIKYKNISDGSEQKKMAETY